MQTTIEKERPPAPPPGKTQEAAPCCARCAVTRPPKPPAEHGHAPHGHDHAAEAGVVWWKRRDARLIFICGGAMLAAYALGLVNAQAAHWAFILAMAVGLGPVLKQAVAAARAGVFFSIEMLMGLAAVGAVIIGSAEEAAMVVLLFLIGELLESVTANRARASINSLVDLIPKTARRERADGTLEELPASALAVGDTIAVRPGERIAADGEVIGGHSAVDESPVTGESVPTEKTAGDLVYAGTVNGDGVLRVRVTSAAADNTIARIVRLVEDAQQAKAPTARFIDRFAARYTPFVVLVSVLTMVLPPLFFAAAWGEWIYKGLALLLIGCPCALIISTPTAIAAALSTGARRGLLMKGGVVLENAGKVRVAAFDKTGTLTRGAPQVTDVEGFGADAAEVLRICAALETGSSHPLSAAVLRKAAEATLSIKPAEDAAALAGRGITGRVAGRDYFLGSAAGAAERACIAAEVAQRLEILRDEGKTVSVLVADGAVCGLIAMRDDLRAGAAQAVHELSALGVHCVMLTGDNRRTATAIAAPLAMEVRADLLPQDKQRIVETLKAETHGLVAVVGDGINDAPALAAADIGIAMGGGTDVALETADAAILRGDVRDVAALFKLSRATMRNIYQNIAFALGFKGIFFVTTLLGLTGLWPAVLADTGASMIVTMNAMRLLRWKGK